MRKRKNEKPPSTPEPPKPKARAIDWYTAEPDDPFYSEPWTIVIGGLSGQSRDNPPAPKTEPNTQDSDPPEEDPFELSESARDILRQMEPQMKTRKRRP